MPHISADFLLLSLDDRRFGVWHGRGVHKVQAARACVSKCQSANRSDEHRGHVMTETDQPATATPSRAFGGIGQFLLKTCIVAVVISACTIFVAEFDHHQVGQYRYSRSRQLPRAMGGNSHRRAPVLDKARARAGSHGRPCERFAPGEEAETHQRCTRHCCTLAAAPRCHAARAGQAGTPGVERCLRPLPFKRHHGRDYDIRGGLQCECDFRPCLSAGIKAASVKGDQYVAV